MPQMAVYCYNEYEDGLFSLIMSLVSRYEFQKCVDRYMGDWHTRSFTCFELFKVMIYLYNSDAKRDYINVIMLLGRLKLF